MELRLEQQLGETPIIALVIYSFIYSFIFLCIRSVKPIDSILA